MCESLCDAAAETVSRAGDGDALAIEAYVHEASPVAANEGSCTPRPKTGRVPDARQCDHWQRSRTATADAVKSGRRWRHQFCYEAASGSRSHCRASRSRRPRTAITVRSEHLSEYGKPALAAGP